VISYSNIGRDQQVRIRDRLLTNPVIHTLLGLIAFSLLVATAEYIVDELCGILPAPPAQVPLGDGASPRPVELLPFIIIVTAIAYLLVRLSPEIAHAQKGRTIIGGCFVLAIVLWLTYRFAVYPALTCEVNGGRGTIGLYLTGYGADYVKKHSDGCSCAAIIEEHPEALEKVWSQRSVNWSLAVLSIAYLVTFISFVVLAIFAKEAVTEIMLGEREH
jgi:hypothetical protein